MTLYHTFESAKSVANSLAMGEIRQFSALVPADVLSSCFIEAEGCWVFFLNENIQLPSDCEGGAVFQAYAVAKAGNNESLVYDFRPNLKKMKYYVEMWSLYALGKETEANEALKMFCKQYSEVLSAKGG